MINFKNLHIVHRGNFSYNFPENSIPAFKETLKNEKNIELDVHIIKDGTIVVFHDDNLFRMCGKNIDIKNLTYKELIQYKLSNTTFTIPTLHEVLNLVNGEILLDIELKYDVTNHSLEKNIIKILNNYEGEYFLKSFDPRIVRCLKKIRKKHCMNFKIGILSTNVPHLIASLIYSNPDFISFNYKLLSNKVFRYFSNKKPTLLYTIKNNDEFNSIKDFNGGYILEDYDSIFKK